MSQRIMLEDSDGKTWVTNMTWQELMQKLDHLEKNTSELWAAYRRITERLQELEKPIRQQKILDVLKGEKVPRTWAWINRRANVFYSDLNDLIGDRKIVHMKRGYLINKEAEFTHILLKEG